MLKRTVMRTRVRTRRAEMATARRATCRLGRRANRSARYLKPSLLPSGRCWGSARGKSKLACQIVLQRQFSNAVSTKSGIVTPPSQTHQRQISHEAGGAEGPGLRGKCCAGRLCKSCNISLSPRGATAFRSRHMDTFGDGAYNSTTTCSSDLTQSHKRFQYSRVSASRGARIINEEACERADAVILAQTLAPGAR